MSLLHRVWGGVIESIRGKSHLGGRTVLLRGDFENAITKLRKIAVIEGLQQMSREKRHVREGLVRRNQIKENLRRKLKAKMSAKISALITASKQGL